MIDLSKLMNRLGHKFKNVKLLESALSHRSVGSDNNERLEFLGDSIIGFIITSELYQRHPRAQEGELSRMRSLAVNGDILARLSIDLKINENLRLGVGEYKSGVESRRSILADALEAVVGAIYIDAGLEICRHCLLNWYGEQVDDLSKLIPKKDAKSRLQEWLQARKFSLPTYKTKITGEAHEQTFTIVCSVEGLPYETKGISTTRRRAEQIAAEYFLEWLE